MKPEDSKVLEFDGERYSYGRPVASRKGGQCMICEQDWPPKAKVTFLHWIDPDSDDQQQGDQGEFERVHPICADRVRRGEVTGPPPEPEPEQPQPEPEPEQPQPESQPAVQPAGRFTILAVGRSIYLVLNPAGTPVARWTTLRGAEGIAGLLNGEAAV